MATAPQQGSNQHPLPQSDNSSPSPLSWEGEKMFNIYIYDYCYKRGFRKTARELMSEAELAPDSTPPINARQGLLFEWWSVFWVLFTAKSSGNGPEDAMLYTQHQAHQLAQRQRLQAPGQPLPLGQQPQPPIQPPPPNRMTNGIPSRPLGIGFMPHGPNGVGPPQGPMQPGPNAFPMHNTGPQPNGIPGQPGPPPPPPASIPATQPQNFPSLLPGGQRTSLGGMPQQQQQPPPQQLRGPNGPFQSPNMANSPQNPPSQQPPQHPQLQQHPQPPMNQLGGPSPHLTQVGRGGMLPPNQGMNPMNPQAPGQQGHGPPSSQYPQSGRPPSRTATPGQGQVGMMNPNPSPSLTAGQPPGGQMMSNATDINSQIMGIPMAMMNQIKQDLRLTKDLNAFTPQDKHLILMRFKEMKRDGGPSDNATAGPSNPMMQQQRNQQQRNQPLQQRGKRNSTSPGEEHENLPQNDTSPPDRKRMRRSPMDQSAVPPLAYSHPQQQHPQPTGPQMMSGPQGQMVMMRGPMGAGGSNGGQHPGQSQMGGPMNMSGMGLVGGGGQQPIGVPQMNPPIGHPGGMAQIQNHQMRDQMFRQQMMKGPQPGGGMGNMPGNAGSPPSSDPSPFNLGGQLGQGPGGGPGFGPGPGPNRMGQPKSMMPPPQSPAMNGPPKDQPGGPNGGKNPGPPGNLESPRNLPLNSNNAGQTPNGTGPPTPAPGNQQNQNQGPGQGQQGQGQGPIGVGVVGQNMAPSPSAILGPPSMTASSLSNQSALNSTDMASSIFSSDFIRSVASTLDEFDGNLFRPDGDINFERDFGQWFNPDDVGGLDSMK